MAAAKPTRPKSSPMKYRAMTITIIGRRATTLQDPSLILSLNKYNLYTSTFYLGV